MVILSAKFNSPYMKRIFFVFSALFFLFSVSANAQYWQQEVNYKIDVTLNDQQHSLKGNISFEYKNNSKDELPFIWIHLWPNGYKNNETALYKQVAADKEGKKRLKDFKENGYIDSLSFTANDKVCRIEADPVNIDIIKLILPTPLAPGAKVNISTPFFVKIPGYFSRFGHNGNYYMVSQWYPKPAVYDAKGWHPIPYLDQGEFYSEFGSFDVSITLPSDYVVAATGNLQTATELEAYKKTGAENKRMFDAAQKSFSFEKEIQDAVAKVKPVNVFSTSSNAVKTLHFTENNIHDFAWFASKEFIVQYDTMSVIPGTTIDVFTFHNPKSSTLWYNSNNFVKDAVSHYSNWLGKYPYGSVKAVEGPRNQTSGGMEYPTVTMITSPDASQERLDAVIVHEVGHNWLYGMLASNERDHPWMDEGVNTYLQFRYEAVKYRANSIFGDDIPEEIKRKNADDFQASIYNVMNQAIPMEEPIETVSTGFKNKEDYGTVIYLKTAVWMYVAEIILGRDKMDEALHNYFNEWKFKHPYPEDFKAVFQKTTGKNVDAVFDLLNKKGKVNN